MRSILESFLLDIKMTWEADPYRLYRDLLESPEPIVLREPESVRDVCNALGHGQQVGNWQYRDSQLYYSNEPMELCRGLFDLESEFQPGLEEFVGSYRYPLIRKMYTLEGRLGSGTYGTAHKSRDDDGSVAIKITAITGIHDIRFNELSILTRLRHPNIINSKDVALGRDPSVGFIMSLIIPLADMDIATAFSRGLFKDKTIDSEKICQDLCLGLIYLHENGIWHRDIKPGNCLLFGDRGVISDFGTSIGPHCKSKTLPYFAATTRVYASPEQLLGDPSFNLVSDWWSLGVTMTDILCQGDPFLLPTKEKQIETIVTFLGDPTKTWPEVKSLPGYKIYDNILTTPNAGIGYMRYLNRYRDHKDTSPALLDLIVGCIQYLPQRWSLDQFRKSPFIAPRLQQQLCLPNPDECSPNITRAAYYPNFGTLPSKTDRYNHLISMQNIFLKDDVYTAAHADLIIQMLSPEERARFKSQNLYDAAWVLAKVSIENDTREVIDTHTNENHLIAYSISIAHSIRYNLALTTWYEYVDAELINYEGLEILAGLIIQTGISFLFTPFQIGKAVNDLFRSTRVINGMRGKEIPSINFETQNWISTMGSILKADALESGESTHDIDAIIQDIRKISIEANTIEAINNQDSEAIELYRLYSK